MNIWLIASGLGFLFHGLLILWVGNLPWAFRVGKKPNFEKGSSGAFQIFWLDQYSYIGLVLTLLGLAQIVGGGLN